MQCDFILPIIEIDLDCFNLFLIFYTSYNFVISIQHISERPTTSEEPPLEKQLQDEERKIHSLQQQIEHLKNEDITEVRAREKIPPKN